MTTEVTIKEKALKIVKSYKGFSCQKCFGPESNMATAKQCACIAVDIFLEDLKQSFEISKELHPHAEGLIAGMIVSWKMIKTEIEKL